MQRFNLVCLTNKGSYYLVFPITDHLYSFEYTICSNQICYKFRVENLCQKMSVAPPRPRGPHLNALRAFESAARLGGFKAAAEELCVTPGAIAQHIKTYILTF